MEKDYFKDRSKESTLYNAVNVGDTVYICTKEMQKSAKELKDLTKGTVLRKLTRHDHPRGIKVQLQTEQGDIEVGRVVYLMKNNETIYGGTDNKAFRTDIIEEEDYYKDRSKESTQYNALNRGDTVYILEHRMQPFASTMEHLVKGVIKRITRCDNPRGVEVQIVNEYDFEYVGRVVYVEKNGKILYGEIGK